MIVAIVSLLLSLVGYYIFPRWRRSPTIQTKNQNKNKINIANDDNNNNNNEKEKKEGKIRWSYNSLFAEYSYLFGVVASFIAIYSTHAYLTRIFFLIHLLRGFWPLLSYQHRNKADTNITESTISSLLYRTLPFFGLALVHIIVEESICLSETRRNGVCYAWFPTDAVAVMAIGFLLWGFGYQYYSYFFNKIRERKIAPQNGGPDTPAKSSAFSPSRLLNATAVPVPTFVIFMIGSWMLTVSYWIIYPSFNLSSSI